MGSCDRCDQSIIPGVVGEVGPRAILDARWALHVSRSGDGRPGGSRERRERVGDGCLTWRAPPDPRFPGFPHNALAGHRRIGFCSYSSLFIQRLFYSQSNPVESVRKQ
ncbi:hypothetical protein NL676_031163 [Syzygium grande]|nr:hypothetical protein NL676_031163 [Syzygium grande]